MSVFNPQETVAPGSVSCSGTARVTIRFEAEPEITAKPADIILIMDRSGSMASPKIDSARAAAMDLIRTVAEVTGNAETIQGGTRIGLASFADTASQDVLLTADTAALCEGLDRLTAYGTTNHNAGFNAGKAMYDKQSPNRKVMVMFTDGENNEGGDPAPTAESIKAGGVELFCIGLLKNTAAITRWASDPKETHVASTEDYQQLTEVFRKIAWEIIQPGAADAVIQEEVTPDFEIVNTELPTAGTVELLDPHRLVWTIGSAGQAKKTDVSLSFEIRHVGETGAEKEINKSITYQDRAGNTLVFPNPTIKVVCDGSSVVAEPCPQPTAIEAGNCEDAVIADVGETSLLNLGRIIQVDATVRHICPGRRAAAAVFLTEVGADGTEYPRGMKTVLIPPQTGTDCRDVMLRCIQFVVPEALDVEGSPDSICNARKFHVRVMANYIDTDFVCCDADNVIG